MFEILLQLTIATLTQASGINSFVTAYSYFGIFILMMLENASLPVPSEIVLPLVGYFSAQGTFNFWVASAVVLGGELLGIAIDYYIAYYIGRNFVYKYFQKLGVSRERIDEFDVWFKTHGSFTVFIARLMPIIRGLISFPAGFAKMNKSKFFFYSAIGSAIWNLLLMAFGFYALSISNVNILIAVVALFIVLIYLIYRYALGYVERESKSHAGRKK